MPSRHALDMEDEVARHRALDRAGRRIKVMVLVKASPQPSATYGDTVCVAGVVLAPGPLRWVRLYPVPFRYMDGDRQFKKYEVIDVKVRDAGADKRQESLKIDAQSLKIEGHIDGWERRSRWVEPLDVAGMCEIRAAVQRDINVVSLGAVRPREVHQLEIEEHPGWTVAEQARFERYAQQGDLFSETPPQLLDPPRKVVRLVYSCAAPECPGHRQRIIDWELTALQRRLRNQPDSVLDQAIQERFMDNMYASHKRPLIFVGNQENVARRASFTVLGTYYPAADQVVTGGALLF